MRKINHWLKHNFKTFGNRIPWRHEILYINFPQLSDETAQDVQWALKG